MTASSNAMNAPERKVTIHRFGESAGVSLTDLAADIAQAFNMEVGVGDSLPVPRDAMDRHRRQYRSHAFLTSLAELQLPESSVIAATVRLGITDADLFVPGLNFVFGEADAAHGVAVISLHRLRPEFYAQEQNPDLLKERAYKEAVHELGHVFGLPHCHNSRCIMHFSNSIADTDFKGPGFCEECRARLAAVIP